MRLPELNAWPAWTAAPHTPHRNQHGESFAAGTWGTLQRPMCTHSAPGTDHFSQSGFHTGCPSGPPAVDFCCRPPAFRCPGNTKPGLRDPHVGWPTGLAEQVFVITLWTSYLQNRDNRCIPRHSKLNSWRKQISTFLQVLSEIQNQTVTLTQLIALSQPTPYDLLKEGR